MSHKSIFGDSQIGTHYDCSVVCKDIAGGKSNVTEEMQLAISIAANDERSPLASVNLEAVMNNRLVNAFERDASGYPFVENYVIMGALRQAAKQIGTVKYADGNTYDANAFVENSVSILDKQIPLIDASTGDRLKVGRFVAISFINKNQEKDIRYVEVFDNVQLDFVVYSFNDLEDWSALWKSAEANGLGAARNHDYGNFVVVRWGGRSSS